MIAIKRMEIPQKCTECPCFDRDYGCRAGLVSSCDIGIERSKDCPLTEIITCEDCKHRNLGTDICDIHEECVPLEHYCADGERRE